MREYISFMSDIQTSRLKYLLDQFAADALTEAEFSELFALIGKAENEGEVREVLATDLEAQVPGSYDRLYWAEQFRGLNLSKRRGAVRSLFNWKRVAVAASILLVIGLGSYFMFFNKPAKQAEIAKTPEERFKDDVEAPKVTRAMITLADGRKVYLDSANNGTLATQDNIKVIKTDDGKLVYQTDGSVQTAAVVFNTLSNPRGSKVIDMTLSDGSHVWLNAGSSVTYPISFVGNERKVSITGEAYFEVAHNADKPFKVSKGEMEVTVLGTHFNVNAFDDENDIKVTLLEGSVRVKVASSQAPRNDDRNEIVIKPGQQAQVAGEIKVTSNVDVDQVMAWKNGLFDFREATIETIMQELSRWYGIDVKYEAKINQHYMGKIYRSSNASEVLKMLELVGGVHFRIEGNVVVVMK